MLLPLSANADKYFLIQPIRYANGKAMCAKKNDKPTKSKKYPKWHIDRQCCLDPYEIPNPKCYYGVKHQPLLNKYHKKFKK